MLEQLRMQEVSQIILSKPEGAVIPGKDYGVGEPVMIINNPALSTLSFVSKAQTASDAQGFIGAAGITNNIEFVINDGSILYALWSYIYGYDKESNNKPTVLKGVEYITMDEEGHLPLTQAPNKLYLYEVEDNKNILIPPTIEMSGIPQKNYEVCEKEIENGFEYYIDYPGAKTDCSYLASYEYTVEPTTISHIKQIHNNIFCSMDIYIDAVDLKNDDKHTVYIHCNKVQVDTDLILSINDSGKASFTPIKIKSIADGESLNKDVATIMVV